MKVKSSVIEFRGSEDKSFLTEDGKMLAMKVFRFEDETGFQNEFYVKSDRINEIPGLDSLAIGCLYKCVLSIGKYNKARLLEVCASE